MIARLVFATHPKMYATGVRYSGLYTSTVHGWPRLALILPSRRRWLRARAHTMKEHKKGYL